MRRRVGAENVPHTDGPELATNPRQRHVFNVQTTIEKERQARPESLHLQAAVTKQFDVGESIGESVGCLLNRGRAGLGDVVTADRDGIPPRQVRGGVFNHVGEKAQRRLDREDNFILRLDLLENVGLDRAAKRRDHLRTKPPLRRGNIHREDDRSGSVDGHGDGKMFPAQRKAGIKPFHVFHGIQRHAAFADFPEDAVGVAVEAVECRAVESGAESDVFLMAREVVEAVVGVFGQGQPGEKARGFLGVFCAGIYQVHFAISGVHEREFTGQSFSIEVAGDFTRFIGQRQGQARQFQGGGDGYRPQATTSGLPTCHQLLTEL